MKLSPLTTGLRHRPLQVRGQRKVEHILRTAEALFAEVSFEAATTNAIAARAKISIGSLYQFFSSKEEILEAIADRYLEQTRAATDQILREHQTSDLEVVLDQLLQTLVKLQDQRPYYLQCLSRVRPTPGVSVAANRLSDELTVRIEQFLAPRSSKTDIKTMLLRSRICVETLGALLPVAVRVRGHARAEALVEIRQVLVRYLAPTLTDQGSIE